MNTAWEQLTQGLIRLAEMDRKTPCQGRRHDRWTSDDPAERAWAGSVCTSLRCSLMDACRAAADESDERFGVWAGVDRTSVKRKRGAA